MKTFNKILLSILIVLFPISVSWAATWYVDGAVGSSGDGQSWATAWKALSNITGVSAGDTVYISGGTISQTYPMSSPWSPIGGTTNNPVIYKIGQEAGHNGTAIFDGGGAAIQFIINWNGLNWVTIDGEYNGARHITIQGFNARTIINCLATGFTLKYLNIEGDNLMSWPNSAEIAYCYFHSTWDEAIGMGGDMPAGYVPAYGRIKIHHNTFNLLTFDSGQGYWAGPDGIKWIQSTDFYNNYMYSTVGSPVANLQHQDGLQFCGSYNRIYNNTFENMADAGIYLGCTSGPVSDVQVYNNVIFMSNSSMPPGHGIPMGSDNSVPITFTRFIVANNTLFSVAQGVFLSPKSLTTWVPPNIVYNNITYNSLGNDFDPAITGYNSPTNVVIRDNNCGNHFISCRTLSGSGFAYDFRLKSTDTMFKGQGTSMSSYFTIDGVSGPQAQGPAWDIGAYLNQSNSMAAPANLRIIPSAN